MARLMEICFCFEVSAKTRLYMGEGQIMSARSLRPPAKFFFLLFAERRFLIRVEGICAQRRDGSTELFALGRVETAELESRHKRRIPIQTFPIQVQDQHKSQHIHS